MVAVGNHQGAGRRWPRPGRASPDSRAIGAARQKAMQTRPELPVRGQWEDAARLARRPSWGYIAEAARARCISGLV